MASKWALVLACHAVQAGIVEGLQLGQLGIREGPTLRTADPLGPLWDMPVVAIAVVARCRCLACTAEGGASASPRPRGEPLLAPGPGGSLC